MQLCYIGIYVPWWFAVSITPVMYFRYFSLMLSLHPHFIKFLNIIYLFLRQSYSVAQAGVQWRDLSSLQDLHPWVQAILVLQSSE